MQPCIPEAPLLSEYKQNKNNEEDKSSELEGDIEASFFVFQKQWPRTSSHYDITI